MGPGSAEAYITLADVSVAFGRRRALDRVSLTVAAGEIVTLIGPNGAGKTTLLRVVLGLQRPSAGSVTRKPGLCLGYLPQRLAIDDTLPLTVRRFLGLVPGGRKRLAQALAEVGAADTVDLPVQTLSGGELQRVLLARALLRDPDLLVLDEPMQGVDLGGQAQLLGFIRAIRDRRNCAVLMVSHDLDRVMRTTDRVVCLAHRISCSGRPAEVRRDPAYRALFGPAFGDGDGDTWAQAGAAAPEKAGADG